MVSTPYIPVPPPGYGGTELIVDELVTGLHAAGHEVFLYTTGRGPAASHYVRSPYAQPVWPPEPNAELEHSACALADLLRLRPPVDVIHTHCPTTLPLGRFVSAPLVYTIHHTRGAAYSSLYARQDRVRFVAISARQAELLPEVAGRVDVVLHGLDPSRYPLGPGGGDAVFLGRMAREKGPHVAMDVARRAGVRLIMAGQPHAGDEDYFRREVAPRLGEGASVIVGEVNHEEKVPLLGRACALLFPIDWEEPFGLVMIEAMFCGTPVLAFPRGAAPEVIDEGVTGYLCADANQMRARLASLRRRPLDRARCRARAVARFSRMRMVRDYLDTYARAIAAARAHGSTEMPALPESASLDETDVLLG